MKPWNDPARFLKWSVFEREPRMNAKPDQIIFGSYETEQEAIDAKTKYFDDTNYYVKQHDVRLQ